MSSVTSELDPARHIICTMEGGILMTNCAKRPRSSLLASLHPEQQTHATSLVDQLDATPATTVKRSSKFHGVSRHYHNGRCEARAGRVFGNKIFNLGTGRTECKGINAVTNCDLKTYIRWLRTLNSQAIPFTSETEFSFNTSPLKTEIDWGISWKQEGICRKMQSEPSNKSAPSALGILLRSSMFKELVEKNMIYETQENERKKFKTQSDDNNTEFRGIEL